MTRSSFSDSDSQEELLPIPEEAVVLASPLPDTATPRQIALAALRQAMVERQLVLPLGPTIEPEDPGRLLVLNGFALQLACCGFGADRLAVRADHWQEAATAPQLLLAAVVDEENQVVDFPGVLTAEEFVGLSPAATAEGALELALHRCRGGIARLFTLVRLMDPSALPRRALTPPVAGPTLASAVVAVREWFQGRLAESLAGLGGRLIPATAAAFRGGAQPVVEEEAPGAVAVGFILPLGLRDGLLVWGAAATGAEEVFSLTVLLSGGDPPTTLTLRLFPELEGDLLPEGLGLAARQGGFEQSATTPATVLEVHFLAAAEPIEVSVSFPGSSALALPPLCFDGSLP